MEVKLLDQVRDANRTRHYSHRTEEVYVGWIRRFIDLSNPEARRIVVDVLDSAELSTTGWAA